MTQLEQEYSSTTSAQIGSIASVILAGLIIIHDRSRCASSGGAVIVLSLSVFHTGVAGCSALIRSGEVDDTVTYRCSDAGTSSRGGVESRHASNGIEFLVPVAWGPGSQAGSNPARRTPHKEARVAPGPRETISAVIDLPRCVSQGRAA